MQLQKPEQVKLVLKIISVFIIVIAAAMIVLSAITLAGGTMLGSLGLEPVPEAPEDQAVQQLAFGIGAMAIVFGIFMLLVGVFDLITGILGFRGAKGNPDSARKAKVMGTIALVFVAAVNGHLIVSSPTFGTICSAIVSVGIQFSFVQLSHQVQQNSAIQTGV